MTLLMACGKSEQTVVSTGVKDSIDNVVRGIRDADTLQVMLEIYRQEMSLEGQMVVLEHLGRRQRELNRFVAAIESHTEGAEIALQICDTIEMIRAYNGIGTNYRRMSMLEDAATYHYKALRLCESFSDNSSYVAKKNRVVSLNGIGNISLRMGDKKTADSVFRVALQGESELGSALGQAINYANLGSIFESEGQNDSAWIYYNKSLEKNIEAKSDLGKALCYSHFGELYEKDGKYDLAIAEHEKAYLMGLEGKVDKWHWLNSHLNLARIYIKQGKLYQASALLTEAETVAMESRSRDHLADIYLLQHNVHEGNGRWGKALEAYKKSQTYKDSIVSEKNLVQIQNERVQFEYERRQQEIEAINSSFQQEKKLRSIVTIAIIIIAFLSFIAICALLYMLKMRKKKQQALLQLDEVRTTFFTNITHEFRTPLTIIIGYAERLRNGDTGKSELEDIGRTVVHHGKNLLSLINQILDLSKMKSSRNALEYHNGNIVGHIHTLVESMRELTRNKNILLIFSPVNQSIIMDFIPDYITKILSNLISNAIKFTANEGRVYITADVEADKFILKVADSGMGIAYNEIPHIFDVFYQGETGKLNAGTGVGLSLIKQLVESMNGEIEVVSATNEGSVFTITLPMKQGETHWPSIDESGELNSISAYIPSCEPEDDTVDDDNKPVVLIVEDNSDIMNYIASVVKDAHLLFATTGKAGLEKAMTHIPDIIITDIMMPEMDGLEMCREIRSSELTSHIPIIVITAKCSEEDKIKGIKAGVNAYLYKPFNAEELNVTIGSVLAHQRAIQENILRNSSDAQGSDKELTSKDKLFLNKVIDTIYAQMRRQGTLNEDLASALCLSAKQLNRKITALTGESLAKYVLKVKMIHAKKMLESQKELSILEIAQRCGYEDHSNFTRSFKSVFGITPTQYKKEYRAEEINNQL